MKTRRKRTWRKPPPSRKISPRGFFLLVLLFSLVSLTTREEIEITKSDISEFGRGNHLRGCLGCLRSDKSLFVLPSKEITPPPQAVAELGRNGVILEDWRGGYCHIQPKVLFSFRTTRYPQKTEISSNFELVLDGPTRLRGAST